MSSGVRLSVFSLTLLGAVLVAMGSAGEVCAQGAGIFTDGFESGDVSAWSAARELGGASLEVNGAAAMGGSAFGLEVTGGGRAWVETREPDRESSVGLIFFLDPDNWEMQARTRVDILRLYGPGRRHHLRLVLRRAGPGLFRLGLQVRGNRGGYEPIGGGLVLAGGENLVEVEWQAASGPNATDGSAALYLNGELEAREPTLENGRLDVRTIQLGILGGNVGQTRGSFYLDDFQAFRTLAP